MNQLSAIFNQRKSGTLPSDMVQNPQNYGSCMVITTRSGKILPGPSVGKFESNNVANLDEEAEKTIQWSLRS